MRNALLIVPLLFLFQNAYSQNYQLFPEMEIASLMTNEGEIELKDGQVLQGDIGLNIVQTSSGLQRITAVKFFRKGEKNLKYKPEEVKEVRLKADWSDKSLSEANDDGSLKIQVYKEMKADYYIFRSVSDKKGKPRLLQLLNPGFDDAIQIYVDPKSKDSAIASALGKDTAKSYYIVRTNNSKEVFYVKKSKYKKMFSEIYGSCEALLSEFGEKVKWGQIANHIVFYEENCE